MKFNIYLIISFSLLQLGSGKIFNSPTAASNPLKANNFIFAASEVVNVTSSTADGTYGAGAIIEISVNFSLPVEVTGTPILLLNTGDTAYYVSGTGEENLIFEYEVRPSNGIDLLDTNDLNYSSNSALLLNGATIVNAGDNATLVLPGLGSPNSLRGSSNIAIDTSVPELLPDPFSPENNSLNVALDAILSISFDENVRGAGTANIRIVAVETGLNIILDGATAFSNTNATQLNFNPSSFSLNPSTTYYIIMEEGAITDELGNAYAGFTAPTIWTFSTFGPPLINDYPEFVCPGDIMSIEGQFFTGLSQIILSEGIDQVIIPSTDFLTISEVEVSFVVPLGVVDGPATLEKLNGSTVSATTDNPISYGPSSAGFVLLGDQNFCFDPEDGGVPVKELSVEVEGGSGTYTLTYSENGSTITVNNYHSGDVIAVTPPQDGPNQYELISVTDVAVEFGACTPSLGTGQTINRFRKSVVNAGGTFDANLNFGVAELCLLENNSINLGSAAEMAGNFPSIGGSVQTGVWSIHSGPINGGGFSSDFAQKTSTNMGATYFPSFADAFAGEVILKLTSDAPTNPDNTCTVTEDFLKIRFVSASNANPGQAPNICVDGNGSQINLVQLNGTPGPNASGVEWTLDDNYYIPAEYDGSWGFADNPGAVTFTASSNNPNAYYRARADQLADEDVRVQIASVSTGGACGGSSSPVELIIPVNYLPQPANLNGPLSVCSGEQLVRFSVDPDTNFSNSTFEWSITNQPANQFDGGRNGSSVFVNFRENNTANPIVETITVREINPNTDCVSNLLSFNITIQPNPIVSVNFTGSRAFSQSAGLLRLQGSDSAIVNTTPAVGGVFSGPGVVLNSDSFYYINTAALSTTTLVDPADVHTITFTYQDALGCTNSVDFGIDIFDANDIFPELANAYCATDESVEISVNAIVLESTQTVTAISGPGITYNGGNNATFDPAIARETLNDDDNIVSITYSVYNSDTDTEIQNAGSQNIEVFANPSPIFIGISNFYCSDDSNIPLLRNTNLNPNTKFSFSLVNAGLPENVISGDAINGYFLNPHQLSDLLNINDSLDIFIRYTYFNTQDCQSDSVFSTVIYKRPGAPGFENTALCIVNGAIETAIVNNLGEFTSETIEWYANEQLRGQPIHTGPVFTPESDDVLNNETTFYVVRRNTQSANSRQCISPVSTVTFKRIESPDFDWMQSSYTVGDSIQFTGSANSIDLQSSFWILEKKETAGFVAKRRVDLAADDSSIHFNFNEWGPGLYKMTYAVENDFACIASISKEMVIVEEMAIDQKYRFNFDDQQQGWVATGTNSSWEWAIPQAHPNASIANENAFWITEADSTYNRQERSYVYSPVLNLSQIDKPSVSFDLWLDIIPGTDGLILEYSTDTLKIEYPNKNWERLGSFENNVSSGINWYNRSGIRSEPGTGSNNLLRSGWTTNNDSTVVATNARHILDNIDRLERVMFRFHFASSDNEPIQDGVAFDNFNIESRNRTVLVEYFGNDASTNDAIEMAFLKGRSENTADFTWINYRVDDSDPFFKENASGTLSRMFFYNAYSPESTFSLDGNYFASGLIFNSAQNQNILNQRALIPSPMEINFDIGTVSEEELEIKVNLTSNIPLNEFNKLHVMVVNDEIDSAGKTYYNVLRKFLTPGTGFAMMDRSDFSSRFKVSSPLDILPLSVIAFVQNDSTSEVLQVAVEKLPPLSTDLVLSNAPLEIAPFRIYPNPANSAINFYTKIALRSDFKGRIIDLTGKTVREFKLQAQSTHTVLKANDLMNGLYSIQLWSEDGRKYNFKLVIKH